MLIFLLTASVSVLVHELGHAAAQRLCGMPVHNVIWGRGPCLFRAGILEIRLIPLAGYVLPNGALMANKRWQGVVIALSGMAATWLVAAVIYATQAVRIPCLRDFSVAWMFWSLAGISNLVPLGRTDGRWVLSALGVLPMPGQGGRGDQKARGNSSRPHVK